LATAKRSAPSIIAQKPRKEMLSSLITCDKMHEKKSERLILIETRIFKKSGFIGAFEGA
jgi:hypothetical protein